MSAPTLSRDPVRGLSHGLSGSAAGDPSADPPLNPAASPGILRATRGRDHRVQAQATTGAAAEPVRLDAAGARPEPGQIAMVPGAEVPLLRLELPPGLRGQAREQVARRQIRDRMGLDEGRVEMRPLPPRGRGEDWTRVLLVDAARMAGWRDAPCRALLPDYLCLPAAEGVWTATALPTAETADSEPGVMLRLGPDDGFTAGAALAPLMLRRALAEATEPPAALYRLGPPLPGIEAVLAAQGIPVLTSPEELAARSLPLPRAFAHGEAALDLRADPRAARARLRRRLTPWLWPLALAALAAGLWAAAELTALGRIEARSAAVRAETEALVRRHFVPAGPILDVRTQVARALAEMQRRSGSDRAAAPLTLLGAAAEVLAASPGRLDEVSFEPGTGLVLALHLPDFAALEALAAALRGAGLEVAQLAARTDAQGAGVRSELRLGAVGERR